MSKRDYKAIAAMLYSLDTTESAEMFKSRLVSKLAVYFEENYSGNYAFKGEKFRLACYGKKEDY